MVPVKVDLTKKQCDALAKLAKGSGKTQSELIHEAIVQLLERFGKKQRLPSCRNAAGT